MTKTIARPKQAATLSIFALGTLSIAPCLWFESVMEGASGLAEYLHEFASAV